MAYTWELSDSSTENKSFTRHVYDIEKKDKYPREFDQLFIHLTYKNYVNHIYYYNKLLLYTYIPYNK